MMSFCVMSALIHTPSVQRPPLTSNSEPPKWFKKVPTEVVNAARTYLAKGYMSQGETAAEARRLADVTVNEMLKNGTAYDSMGAFIAEGKLGAKDLTVLIKRKEIAPDVGVAEG